MFFALSLRPIHSPFPKYFLSPVSALFPTDTYCHYCSCNHKRGLKYSICILQNNTYMIFFPLSTTVLYVPRVTGSKQMGQVKRPLPLSRLRSLGAKPQPTGDDSPLNNAAANTLSPDTWSPFVTRHLVTIRHRIVYYQMIHTEQFTIGPFVTPSDNSSLQNLLT